MRATDFEFRHRFWFIFALFGVGFSCYFIDHRNAAETVAGFIAPQNRQAVRAVLGIGALLVALAAALRTWAASYLQTTVVKDAALHGERLVADGPYRHVRNPLYLGTLLLTVGIGLLASRLGGVLLVLGMLLIVVRLIGREEAHLLETQGRTYTTYRAAVPALVPAMRPRVPGSGAAPRWGQAFVGELAMWAFAAGVAGFALTLQQRVFFLFLVLGLVLYLPGKTRGGGGRR